MKGGADLACEGDHVVLAETKDVNVAHDDHLLVILGKYRIPNHVCHTVCQHELIHTRTDIPSFTVGEGGDAPGRRSS